MGYSPKQMAYIDSVDGAAHASAVKIIGGLEQENERLTEALASVVRYINSLKTDESNYHIGTIQGMVHRLAEVK